MDDLSQRKVTNKRQRVQDKLESIEKFLIRLCEDNPVEKVTKDFVLAQLELFLNPSKEETVVALEVSFFDIFEDYIAKKNISEWASNIFVF